MRAKTPKEVLETIDKAGDVARFFHCDNRRSQQVSKRGLANQHTKIEASSSIAEGASILLLRESPYSSIILASLSDLHRTPGAAGKRDGQISLFAPLPSEGHATMSSTPHKTARFPEMVQCLAEEGTNATLADLARLCGLTKSDLLRSAIAQWS
jgi:hypothetical protein